MPVTPKFVAIDTESDGINVWKGDRMFAAAAAFPNGDEMFWRDEFSGLRALLLDESVDKVFHNAKHDLRMLEYSGFRVKGMVWDTMILGHLLNGGDAGKNLSLDMMSRKYLPSDKRKVVEEIDQWFEKNSKKGKDKYESFADLPPDMLRRRNVGDACLTRDLFIRCYPTVATVFPFLLKQEHELIHVVKAMEDRGISIDYDEIERQRDEFDLMYEDVIEFCEGVVGKDDWFSLNSKDHQIELLTKGGCIDAIHSMGPAGRTKTGKPKLDDMNLRAIHHPVVHMLMMGKTAVKMRGTFLDQMQRFAVNGVLHPSYNQVGTTTGRFSCSKPNLQNIPIEGAMGGRTSYTAEEREESLEMTGMDYAPHLKRIFRCRPGYAHIHSDKKQAEMYMMGHYANDPLMLKLFNHCIDTNGSIHEEICRELFGEVTKGLKTRTKIVVFGYLYGAGIGRMARAMGGTNAEASATRARLGNVFPGVRQLTQGLEKQIRTLGYCQTVHGRRHYLPIDESYVAISRICQGSVGDEMKGRMIAMHNAFEREKLGARLILNIHDDLGSDMPIESVPKMAPIIKEIMEDSDLKFNVRLPSSLDVTYTRWSDLKEIDDTANIPKPPSRKEIEKLLLKHMEH